MVLRTTDTTMTSRSRSKPISPKKRRARCCRCGGPVTYYSPKKREKLYCKECWDLYRKWMRQTEEKVKGMEGAFPLTTRIVSP